VAARLVAPDVALLPIGSYEPRWIMRSQHMDSKAAVLAHLALGAKTSIAIHFGCFNLAIEGMFAPEQALKAALTASQLPSESFGTLEHGQSYVFRDE
jgi:L-ascorbate metabolism protein UlaG (beta-lactamase superfamily)